jgi:hypothetical protein
VRSPGLRQTEARPYKAPPELYIPNHHQLLPAMQAALKGFILPPIETSYSLGFNNDTNYSCLFLLALNCLN